MIDEVRAVVPRLGGGSGDAVRGSGRPGAAARVPRRGVALESPCRGAQRQRRTV